MTVRRWAHNPTAPGREPPPPQAHRQGPGAFDLQVLRKGGLLAVEATLKNYAVFLNFKRSSVK